MTSVIGHRGASADHPENTIEAFVAARSLGADGVELDVRQTVDGVLVVHHDAELPDGRIIADTPALELPPSLPTLAAALASCVGMTVNVEIKHDPVEPGFSEDRHLAEEVVAEISRRPDASSTPILVSSFDLATIDKVRAVGPDLPTGYLVLSTTDPVDAVAVCLDGGHSAVHPYDVFVDAGVSELCRTSGVALNVWTVDDPGRIAELAGWGVDAVITNRVRLAREVIDAGDQRAVGK